jgi:hypothetical protein
MGIGSIKKIEEIVEDEKSLMLAGPDGHKEHKPD